ncbi:MAG: NAD(P)/FAD-dependent oxidoreductase [Gemmatimonadaceae bacterium]|nr:NAD(P)/FAD-dependent oxidoreductase [Gemmatimonadaceae bacterium]
MPGGASPTLIVGAGPAGLATAAELARRGQPYRLLERGHTIAHTWESLYDSLTLHTGRHMSTLPGLRYPAGTSLFPTRAEFIAYLRRYVTAKGITAELQREVLRLERSDAGWRAHTNDGDVVDARAVVMATGIVAKPRMPELPGRSDFGGEVLHSVSYLRPTPYVGKRVLVVGVGNSGGEIGSELARAGANVTVAVRSGANVVPRQIGPFPTQYVRYLLGNLPRSMQIKVLGLVQRRLIRRYGESPLPRASVSALDAIPLIGFGLVDAIREGRIQLHHGAPAAYTATGVRFDDGVTQDFDVVLFATGYSPAIDSLGTLVQRDARGFAARTDRVTSADQAGLWFVGHNYDHTGGITNIRRDAPLVAAAIAAASR